MSNATLPQSRVSGNLAATTVVEVLRELESAGTNARFWFETKRGPGEVLFRDGMIIRARLGGARGRTALLRLLLVRDGNFGVEDCGTSEGEALVQSVTNLIELHASRQREWEVLRAAAPPLESIPRLTGVGVEVRNSCRGIQRVVLSLIDGQRTLSGVLQESSFESVEALKIVVDGINDGLVLHAQQSNRMPMTNSAVSLFEVLPKRAAVPGSLPVLEPNSAVGHDKSPVAWRLSTLVGLDGHNDTVDASQRSITPSHIVNLGQISLDEPQAHPRPLHEVTERTGTAISGFGLDGYVQSERARPAVTSVRVELQASEANSASGSSDVRRVEGEMPAVQSGQTSIAPQRYVGRYEILKRIGHGGMGSVFLC